MMIKTSAFSFMIAIAMAGTAHAAPGKGVGATVQTAKNHFAFSKVVVADLNGSADFYGRVFQLTERGRGDGNVAGRTYSEVVYNETGAGGATLVLRRYHDKATPSLDEAVVGFVTTDIEATLKRLQDAGGKVVQPPRLQHGNKNSYATDLEGHLIEIVELG